MASFELSLIPPTTNLATVHPVYRGAPSSDNRRNKIPQNSVTQVHHSGGTSGSQDYASSSDGVPMSQTDSANRHVDAIPSGHGVESVQADAESRSSHDETILIGNTSQGTEHPAGVAGSSVHEYGSGTDLLSLQAMQAAIQAAINLSLGGSLDDPDVRQQQLLIAEQLNSVSGMVSNFVAAKGKGRGQSEVSSSSGRVGTKGKGGPPAGVSPGDGLSVQPATYTSDYMPTPSPRDSTAADDEAITRPADDNWSTASTADLMQRETRSDPNIVSINGTDQFGGWMQSPFPVQHPAPGEVPPSRNF